MREPSSAIKRNLPRCEIDCAHGGDSMVWGWMCIQEGALKPMLSSYGCYSCRYRVRGHCQGTRSGGSEALEVSVAVEATAVWSRLIPRAYTHLVTYHTRTRVD